MAQKLKVFTWSDGFHAFTVATSSRPKALKAWGVSQDLFKSGLAHEITEGADHDGALAAPDTVISRGLSVDIGETTRRAAKPVNRKAQARLAVLEAELETLDAAQAQEDTALAARRTALEKEAERLAAAQRDARAALVSKLKRAREAAR